MKRLVVYFFIFTCLFMVNGNVFAQIEKTNDQLCYEQVGPSRYHKWPDSLGGGASCDCLDGYEWDIATLHCLKKETNLTEKQNQALEKAREHILDIKKAKILEQIDTENNIKQSVTPKLNKKWDDSINLFLRNHRVMVLLVGGCFFIWILANGVAKDRGGWAEWKERRKIKKESSRVQQEEANRIKKEKEAFMLKQKEEDMRQEKEARMAEYQQLRKEIEAMPKYENWKRAVFKKNGVMCEMCGETKNLEIHHRQSFYSIVKACGIKNIVQAFENNSLWDIDNGSVLCKTCHAKTKSSKYHDLNNLIQ